MTEAVDKYRNNFPNLKLDEYHCANCLHLDMCLSIGFAQPLYHPDNALMSCSFFEFYPTCSKCNKHMVDIGKDYSHFICRICRDK